METSTSFLELRRAIGDPPADAVIADLASSGSITDVNALMRSLVENDQMPSAELPELMRQYLATTGTMPSWMDTDQVKRAENVFWRYGPQIIVNLFCYSLPYCYAARKGVQVLALTSRLYTNPTRRVIETAQMIIDVMQPGGLLEKGSGVRSAQKVRLMHAGVRAQIAAHPEAWDPSFGVPINQEDLAATMMSFSWIVIDGLRRMGHPVSDADAEAYLHCWKVVGHLLGVEPDLLPGEHDPGRRLHPRLPGASIRRLSRRPADDQGAYRTRRRTTFPVSCSIRSRRSSPASTWVTATPTSSAWSAHWAPNWCCGRCIGSFRCSTAWPTSYGS